MASTPQAALALAVACGGSEERSPPPIDPLAPIINSLTSTATQLGRTESVIISADVVPSQACLDEATNCDLRFGVLLVDGVEVGEFALETTRYKVTLTWAQASQGVSQHLDDPTYDRSFVARFTDAGNRVVTKEISIAPLCGLASEVNCAGTCKNAYDASSCGGCDIQCGGLFPSNTVESECVAGQCVAAIYVGEPGENCDAVCGATPSEQGGAGVCEPLCAAHSSPGGVLEVYNASGGLAMGAYYGASAPLTRSESCSAPMAASRQYNSMNHEFVDGACCCRYTP